MERASHKSRITRTGIMLLWVMIALPGGGCETYHDVSSFQLQQQEVVEAKPYRIAPPDVLRIESSVVREIGDLSVTVSPDGTVMLPLLGTAHVAGKTTEQVATMLREQAMLYYEEADVSVNVRNFRSKHVYVFGEVALAGKFPYTGSNNILELLAAAQPTRAADRERIQILRPGGDGETVRMTVKLSELVTKGNVDRNAVLEDGDIVFVPANGFAEIGYAIQNLLRPVAPAAATVQGLSRVDTGQASLRSSGANP
jgi:polysaccharide export outer membrane protein